MSGYPGYGQPGAPGGSEYPGQAPTGSYGAPQGGYPGQNPSAPPGSYGAPQQGGYPGQAPPSGYPGQAPPTHGYPGQAPPQGYPGQAQAPPQGYPGQPGQAPPTQGYPGQAPPPQGYPGQAPPQGYPGHAPQPQAQGYPGQPGGYPGQPRPAYGGQQPGVPPGMDPTMVNWFRAVDQDNSGQINSGELSRALQSGNYKNFSEEACCLMISMFDQDRSGTINLQEFGQLFQFISQWTTCYRQFDKDNSGTIDEGEFNQAIQTMGFRLSRQFVDLLMSKYAPRTRRIGLDSFILANIRLRNLTEAFKARDREMKGVINVGYEDFMSMVFGACM